jgi:hypothetical protein
VIGILQKGYFEWKRMKERKGKNERKNVGFREDRIKKYSFHQLNPSNSNRLIFNKITIP